MSTRRQQNSTKVNRSESSSTKRIQKKDKDVPVFTTMEKYLGLNEIRNIIHGDKNEVVTKAIGCLRSNGIKQEIICSEPDELQIPNGDNEHHENKLTESEEDFPLSNVRLSPRKHASTLSRCATTSTENVKTPHRISLCDTTESQKPLTLNPYSKRTRRRLNPALDENAANVETINNNIGAMKQETDNTQGENFSYNTCSDGGTAPNGMKKDELIDRNDKEHLDVVTNGAMKTNGFVAPVGHLTAKSANIKGYALTNGINGKCHPPVLNGKSVKSVTMNGHSNGNRKLTDFFPIRRSVRKTKKEVLEEKHRAIELAILEEREDGLEVAQFEGKGRGVVATRHFRRGEFVVEYAGELVSMQEAKEREAKYAQDSAKGCYMYYFKYNNQHYCIDATAESGRLGRLVNHSRSGNLITKPVFLHHRPHLVLLAGQDISPGKEVMYDYGDRSKESLLAHPWLAL